jgi:hypothetical protein
MLTSFGSEMAREQAEPHTNRRLQMTTDSRRLMRPGVVASTEHNAKRLPVRMPSGLCARRRIVPHQERSYEGLSRMKGNFQVRFLGGCGRETGRTHPTRCEGLHSRPATERGDTNFTNWPESQPRMNTDEHRWRAGESAGPTSLAPAESAGSGGWHSGLTAAPEAGGARAIFVFISLPL